MRYRTRQTKDFLVVFLSGRLTHAAHRTFTEITKLISNAGDRHIIVDVGDLDYIDSSGLGMFMVACEVSHRSGGAFRIRHASAEMKELAARVRADHIMRID